jgi:hypothetical protein
MNLFVRVPDFKELVQKEEKPKFYDRLSDEEKGEYDRDQAQHRMNLWACQTAAAACNWVRVVSIILIVMFTPQFIDLLGKLIEGVKHNIFHL